MSTTYNQTDLSSKTVKDLKAILGDLKLPQTGVKADLVSRILEHQNGSGGDTSGADATATSTSEAKQAGAASASPSTDVAASGPAASSDGVAGTTSIEDGHTTKTSSAATESKQEETLPLPSSTDKQSEAERRANRLKRFGNPDDIAKLERADKFGTQASSVDDKAISRLDSELSNKRQKREKPEKGAVGDAPKAKSNGAAGPASSNNNNANNNKGGRPDLKRTKSANGGTKAANGAASPAKTQQTKAAPPKLDPEEEERRRKRAERFNAGS